MNTREKYLQFKSSIPEHVTLVAVSKTKSAEEIKEIYNLGHRDFGENYVQELLSKKEILPGDIRWHFIGHLQTNKVKFIVPFVNLIHGVDSFKLLKEINKEAVKAGKKIHCLLQLHVAEEETKFGFSEEEIQSMVEENNFVQLTNIELCGVMGMASNTYNLEQIRAEFRKIHQLGEWLFEKKVITSKSLTVSMGMSNDYKEAIEAGSTMVRVGSRIFGERDYSNK